VATDTNAVLDMDVKSILEEFTDLPDPRSHINRLHLLGDLVVICIMAVIAGAEGPRAIGPRAIGPRAIGLWAIGLWAKSNEGWLKGRLRLPNGVPAHDTIGRVLMALKPAAFQACFENWIRRLAANREGKEREIIAIDGKSLRRSHDRAAGLGPLCVVSAWAVRSGISLGQLATEQKSNEISAIPELLDAIDVKGSEDSPVNGTSATVFRPMSDS
jgi:predicted transposase YbfD/YdcC